MQGYNVLSDEKHREAMFDFDLQLFGGGGGGKRGGAKLLGAIAFGFISAGFGFFGAGLSAVTRFALGAQLFSSIWTSNNKQSYSSGVASVQRFERSQESMSSNGDIPVIYGCRQVSGNQTYHQTNSDSTTLWKHVVLCEGGIEGIESVTANDLLIPTGSQTGNTVFTIQNVKYADAWVKKKEHILTLHANGKTKEIYLCTKGDLQNEDASYWDYQVSMSSLISYINRMNEGWQAFPVQSTNKYPGELWDSEEQTQKGEYVYETTDVGMNALKMKPGTVYEKDGWHYKYIGFTYQTPGKPGGTYTMKYFRYADDSFGCYRNPMNFQCSTVTGGTSYTFHDCCAPQNYEEVGGYPNLAWLDMTFTVSSELNGNPSVTCLVKGRQIYDIRSGLIAYSTNPAMCLRDFLLSKRYGMGKWITEDMLDDDSWREAADYCDEQITFLDGQGAEVTAKRYELNMIIDSKRNAIEWIQEILANFCGYLVYSNGKLKLKIEKPTPVSYRFTDNNCSNLKIAPLALSETPNRYEVTIIDPLNNWTAIKCLCDDYADQKERQRIVTKSVSLEGVTSQNQALRLARFYRDYNLVCPMQLSFTTGMQGMHLEPGDVVTVSYHGVFNKMPIRISEIKETNKGTFEISGRQYNETIYGDLLGGGVHWYNYGIEGYTNMTNVPNPYDVNLEQLYYVALDGTHVSQAIVSWKPPKYAFIKKYHVSYRILDHEYLDSQTWFGAGDTVEEQYLTNVTTGYTYQFCVKLENSAGFLSSGAYSQIVYMKDINFPPGPPINLSYTIQDSKVILTWEPPGDPDVKGYHVYMGNGDCGFDACRVVANNIANCTCSIPIEIAETYTFYVQTVDTVDNLSEAAKCLVEIEPLPAVTGFYIAKNGDTLSFFWNEIKGCNYEIRWGSSWRQGTVIARVNANTYTAVIPIVGTQTFSIKAYNGYNLYSATPTYLRVEGKPSQAYNVVAKFDEKELGWHGGKVNARVTSEGLLVNLNCNTGEYYSPISLATEAEARTWLDYDVEKTWAGVSWDESEEGSEDYDDAWDSETDSGITWDDIGLSWDDANMAWVNNNDTNPICVDNFISIRNGQNPGGLLYSFDLNGNTDGARTANGINYADGKYNKGVLVMDSTTLDYDVQIPTQFYLSFTAKPVDISYDVTYMVLDGAGGQLRIERTGNVYSLVDDNSNKIQLSLDTHINDQLTFKIYQSASTRTLEINGISAVGSYAPVGSFSEIKLYSESGHRANAVIADIIISTEDIDTTKPIGYSDWIPFVGGDYTYKDALIRTIMTHNGLDGRPLLTNLVIYADLPNIQDHGTLAIGAEETWIQFAIKFYEPPDVTVTTIASTAVAVPNVTRVTRDGFAVVLRDTSSELVAGTISWTAAGC